MESSLAAKLSRSTTSRKKIYIDQVLGVEAIPVALGIYFVFRDEGGAQIFRQERFAIIPRVRSQIKFEDYQELLAPLMAFVTERGRLPVKSELPEESNLTAEFGTLRRAFQIILQATDPQEWKAIAEKTSRPPSLPGSGPVQ